MNEADSFLRLRSKTSRQHWRAAAVESISPVALGGSEEVTEGLRPCTLSSLDTSAPFSFLAPCCYMYPRLRQEGTVRKKAKSCLYSRALLPCTWRQGLFAIICGLRVSCLFKYFDVRKVRLGYSLVGKFSHAGGGPQSAALQSVNHKVRQCH